MQKSILYSLLITIALLFLPALTPAAPDIFTDQELANHVALREESTSGSTAVLQYELKTTEWKRFSARGVHSFWIAAPETAKPTLTLLEAEWIVVGSDGKADGPYGLDEEPRWGKLPGPMLSPRITFRDTFRLAGLHVVELVVSQQIQIGTPEQYEQGQIILVRAKLKLDLGSGDGELVAANVNESDPYLVELLSSVIANPGQLGLAVHPPSQPEETEKLRLWNERLHRAERDGFLLMAKLPRSGIYRLTGEQLKNAGFPAEEVDPSRLQLFVGGQEIPAVEMKMTRGRLVADAKLVFYAPELGERKPFIPVWLMRAPKGETPLRTQVSEMPTRTTVPEPAPAFQTIELFQPNSYNHGLPADTPYLKWQTAEITDNSFFEMEFDAPALSGQGVPAELKVWVTTLEATHISNYTVFLNGQAVGSGELRGRRVVEETFQVPLDKLREGTNRFAIQNMEVASGERSSLAFLTGTLRIPVTTRTILPNQEFILDLPNAGKQSLAFRRIAADSQLAVAADIANPFQPVIYSLRTTRQGEDSFGLSDMEFNVPNPRVVFAEEGTMYLAAFEPVPAPRSFVETRQVDYLAIYHPELGEALEPLLAHRAASQTVDSLPVTDIYAAFSYGTVSYEAIHDCIRHTFSSRHFPRLSEVLLVGEGSEVWWEMQRDATGVTRNLVPVFGWANPTERIRGDDGYAQISGGSMIPDIEIGRISVNDAAELRPIVEKIIGYDTNPPKGEWMSRHVLVTDDEPEFDRVALEMMGKSLDGPNVPTLLSLAHETYEDYFRGRWRKRSAAMTDRIIEAWNNGASTITYFGHGGPNLWSGERILHIRDIDRTDVQGRFPLLVAGSCDTGWVDYPIDPVRSSLAEMMLRSPKGGVIAAYIPIAGTSSYEHNYLLTGFFHSAFSDGVTDIGKLTLFSKLNYLLYRTNVSVTEQYLLMGDPGVQLARPAANLTLAVTPAQLLTVTGGEMAIEGTAPEMDWGVADVSLLGPDLLEVARGRLRVQAGRFSGTITIPDYLSEGNYRLVAMASNESMNMISTAYANIPVLPHKISVNWETSPSAEEALPIGTPIKISYTVLNDSSVDLAGAVLRVQDAEREGELSTHPVSLAAGQKLTRSFTIPVPKGVNAFRAELFHRPLKQGEQPIPMASDLVLLKGLESGESRDSLYVGFSHSEKEMHQYTNQPGTLVRVPLYNLRGKSLPALSAALRINSPDGPRIGSVVNLQPLRNSKRQVVEFRTNETLSNAEQLFVLELLAGDVLSTKTLQLFPFTMDSSLGPDLEIVDAKVVLENENPMSGKTLFVRYNVRNRGQEPIEDVVTNLYLNTPWVEAEEAPTAVPWNRESKLGTLAPGEERQVRMRWDHQGTAGARVTLYATVSSAANIQETDAGNNVASSMIELLPPPNLALDLNNLKVSTTTVHPYDRVQVTIPILNDSPFDFARSFRLSAYVTTVEGKKRRVLRRDFPEMRAGESATIQFEWFVQPGEYMLDVDLNEDREYIERSYGDNATQITFTYIFDSRMFAEPDKEWDFSGFPTYSTSQGIVRLPGGRLTVAQEPDVAMLPYFFHKTHIEGPAGPFLENDNLFGITERGIYTAYAEKAPPVKFLFELPKDDHTTYYDFFIGSGGDRNPQYNSGHFQYRLEGEEQWQNFKPTAGEQIKLARIETVDDSVVLELRLPEFPTENHISAPKFRPVIGIFTSPVISGEQLPRGYAVVDKVLEGKSRVELEVRHGVETDGEPVWAPWQTVSETAALPAPPEKARLFQWRAFLVAAPDGKPELRSVKFEVPPPAQEKIAAAGN